MYKNKMIRKPCLNTSIQQTVERMSIMNFIRDFKRVFTMFIVCTCLHRLIHNTDILNSKLHFTIKIVIALKYSIVYTKFKIYINVLYTELALRFMVELNDEE